MARWFVWLMILSSLLLVTSCAWFNKEPPEEVLNDSQETITQQQFIYDESITVLSHLSKDTTPVRVSLVDGVVCNQEEDTLSFYLVNKGFRVWSLDQRAAPDDQEFVNVQVMLNGRAINSRNQQINPETSEVLFGPNNRLSENCGGRQTLRPGQSVQCEISTILWRDENVLRVQSHHADPDDQIRFRCKE